MFSKETVFKTATFCQDGFGMVTKSFRFVRTSLEIKIYAKEDINGISLGMQFVQYHPVFCKRCADSKPSLQAYGAEGVSTVRYHSTVLSNSILQHPYWIIIIEPSNMQEDRFVSFSKGNTFECIDVVGDLQTVISVCALITTVLSKTRDHPCDTSTMPGRNNVRQILAGP